MHTRRSTWQLVIGAASLTLLGSNPMPCPSVVFHERVRRDRLTILHLELVEPGKPGGVPNLQLYVLLLA